MKKIFRIISVLAAAATLAPLASCSDDHEGTDGNTCRICLDLSVCGATADTRLNPGDPGYTEYFEAPRYVYLFFAVGPVRNAANNPVFAYTFTTEQSDWTLGEDVYTLTNAPTKTINIDPSLDLTHNPKIRAYIVASFDALTFVDQASLVGSGSYSRIAFSEKDLIDARFYATGSGSNPYSLSLRDVYSTPYNLKYADNGYSASPTVENRDGYYGTVPSGYVTTTLITFSDTLYHTAAKVDFQWNAADPTADLYATSAVILNAPTQGYLFRPASTVTGVGTYSKLLLAGDRYNGGTPTAATADDMNNNHEAKYADVFTSNVGNQWSGRAYTYVLQPGNLEYNFSTSQKDYEAQKATTSDNGSTNRIFAAWYKADFQLGESK